jgi:dipeptidyl aminopeptidase/acylaminoacyl peptidase
MAYPSLYEYDFVKGKYIKSKNSNGHLLEGFLYVPEKKNQLKAPMIVMPHGGPIGVQDLNEFDPETQFLINRGYAVLKVNFRGSSGYGHEFMESGRAEFGKGIEQDIDTIVQLALKNKNIDASRLCIYGQSYGGYSALISTVLSKGKYKCAISAFGVTDLPLTFISSNLHQLEEFQKAIKNTVGDIDTDYEKLVDSSPVYRADEIDVPVLLFAGKLDMVAAYEHSSRLNYMLNFFNSDVDFVSYDTEHGHKNWLGDRHQYLTIVEFLDRVLGVSRKYSDKDKDVLAEEFYILGELHRLGKYVNEDKKKAEKYLRLSQKYGHDLAATKLRVMGIYDF